MTRLRDQRETLARKVVAEGLESVEVRVRSEQAGVVRLHELGQPGLGALALGADLGEAGGKDHRELRLLLDDRLERFDRVAGEDHSQVVLAGYLVHRAEAGQSVDAVAVRVHRMEGGAELLGPGADLAGHRRRRLVGCVRSAEHRNRARSKERVEVESHSGDDVT